jgi:hypothetical protein
MTSGPAFCVWPSAGCGFDPFWAGFKIGGFAPFERKPLTKPVNAHTPIQRAFDSGQLLSRRDSTAHGNQFFDQNFRQSQ